VALEAQASGTPVIVSRAVPPEAVIHGVTGFRLSTFDPNEYAKHIIRLLSDEALWQKMSFYARKHAERFHITTIAQLYIDLIEKMSGRTLGSISY
jgi:glycosyltransferase involved in cell wall biosynthesis